MSACELLAGSSGPHEEEPMTCEEGVMNARLWDVDSAGSFSRAVLTTPYYDVPVYTTRQTNTPALHAFNTLLRVMTSKSHNSS